MTDSAADDAPRPLEELRALLRDAQAAAARVREEADAARTARAADGEAPDGWATSEERRQRLDDLQVVTDLVRHLRELVPADLQAQVTELLHNLLLLAKALLDWGMERLTALTAGPPPPPATDSPVSGDPDAAPDDGLQDIPID